MSDLEILAELKKAYEYMTDIEENADIMQITKFSRTKIIETIEALESIYWDMYKKIVKENKQLIYYKDNIKIGHSIYIDYIIDGEPVSYKDLDQEAKWWNDYNYL